jgi:hypothetical protein
MIKDVDKIPFIFFRVFLKTTQSLGPGAMGRPTRAKRKENDDQSGKNNETSS